MINRLIKSLRLAYKISNNRTFADVHAISNSEVSKLPTRTDILNYLLSLLHRETSYLEIGVRNPNDNFANIHANTKFSVDPGVEYKENPVDFRMTSDEFFRHLQSGEILSRYMQFDVIFIDGLHLAEQVDRDVANALKFVKEDGFIVLHDCNPPTEWHAREDYYFPLSPAKLYWNGTTWKAFLKYRFDDSLNSCCVDTDWGVGILSKSRKLGKAIPACNPYFEYNILNDNRRELLNLVSFDTLRELLRK